MVEPARWPRVKEVLNAALELEAAERASYLDGACAGDSALRHEVDSLLAASTADGRFSNPTWSELFAGSWKTPEVVGRYRLQRELGSGGMGQVWLAEQVEPVKRLVAVKLIRGGFYDPNVLERFLEERRSLALMNHPAIAKVFDAGATDAGQPYLAMEYVDGLSITAYCDEKKLGLPERLRLFRQVCDGVQHAHQKAIIHRDLKPSNILIAEVDGRPEPRIIDFGLAKSASDGRTDLTLVGSFLGTPGYISPEQADASSEDVDTRADVYSLGVILYELLVGCLPFDAQKRKQFSHNDEELLRPSTRARKSTTVAESRGLDSRQLVRTLRGDLDAITLKALERNREHRYGSPAELSADLERYLENRPVVARPASRGYLLRKYLVRHRMAAALSGVALLLLIAFTANQSIQLRRIQRERDRADRIATFMKGLFKVSSPSEARGNNLKVREILDKGSQQIQTGLNGDPELQAELMDVMGRVYQELALLRQTRLLLERSLAIRRRVLGNDDPKTLVSMDDLAWLLDQEGRPAEAIKLQEESLSRRRRVQPDSQDIRKSNSNLAVFLFDAGRFGEAEKLERETLADTLRLKGPGSGETVAPETNLATSLLHDGKFAEAKTALSHAVASGKRALGPTDPLVIAAMHNLAYVLFRLGEYAKAEQLQLETREIETRVLGPTHPQTAESTYNLALIAEHQGDRERALGLLKEAITHGLGPEELAGLNTDEDLASIRQDQRFRALVNQFGKKQGH